MMGGAFLTYAGPDTNADGLLDFSDGEVITAADINANFSSTGTRLSVYEDRIFIADDGRVGIGTETPAATLSTVAASGVGFSSEVMDESYAIQMTNGDFGKTWGLYLSGNDLAIREDGVGDALYLEAGGRVGIGTATPGGNLNIVGTTDPVSVIVDAIGSAASNFSGRRSRGTVGAPSAALSGDSLTFFNGKGYGTTGFTSLSNVAINMIAAENQSDTAHGTAIKFDTTQNGTTSRLERMRIDNTGNVGIGTTTPQARLDVNGGIRATELCDETGANCKDISSGWTASSQWTTSGTDLYYTGGKVGIGTTTPAGILSLAGASPTLYINGTDTANQNLWFQSQGAATFAVEAQSATGGAGSYLSNRINNGAMYFRTTNSGGALNINMAVTGSGNVGIGTQSPGYKLEVAGGMGATGYTTTSDARLKQDVEPIEGALEGVQCLTGVTYRWRDRDLPQTRQMGLIAQDVESCFPELVTTRDDGIKGVLYSQLVAPLIEAVKDLAGILETHDDAIEAQQQRIADLERQVQLQQSRIETLTDTAHKEQQRSAMIEARSSATEARMVRIEAMLQKAGR